MKPLNIHLEVCTDFAIINQIAAHKAILPFISDDGVINSEIDFSKSPMFFVLIRCDEQVAGFYGLQFHNSVMLEIHTCLLPEFRGTCGNLAAKKIIALLFENTVCRKLITYVPSFNRPALVYAKRAGLQVEGCIKKSFLKDGILFDQILLGIEKE